jgi:hypothetical protein
VLSVESECIAPGGLILDGFRYGAGSAPAPLNFTHKYTLDTVRVRNPSGWA